MAILLMCTNPQCGELFDVPDDAAGTEVPCPSCGTTQLAPASVPVQQIRKPDGEQPPAGGDRRTKEPEAEVSPTVPEQVSEDVDLRVLELTETEAPQGPSREDLIYRAKLASQTEVDLTAQPEEVESPPPGEQARTPSVASEYEPGREGADLVEEGLGGLMDEELTAREADAIGDDLRPAATEEGVLESRRVVGGAFVLGYVGMACGLAGGVLLFKTAPIFGAYAGSTIGWVVGFVFALMVIFAIDKADFRQVRCAVCDNIFPAGTPACTFCGSRLSAQAVSSLAAECLWAGSHAVKDKATIYWMAMLLVLTNVLIFGTYHFLNEFSTLHLAGRAALIALCALVGFWICGYWFEFFAKGVADAMYRPVSAPSLPRLRLLRTLGMGLKGLGMLLIYVAPIFTLPLLPLGMLALGTGRRRGMFNLTGGVAVVWNHTKDFAILWLLILMWLAAIALGVSLIAMVIYLLNQVIPDIGGSTEVAFSMMVSSVAAMMFGAVISVFGLAIFRSVGMFARYNPRTLESGGPRPVPVEPVGP